MYQIIYPEKDSTVYSQFSDKNTGVDQILELNKQVAGSPSLDNDLEDVFYADTYNTRIFIKFDITKFNQQVTNYDSQYFLVLRATESTNLPIEYTVEARPMSGSWTNGTGFFNNFPNITNGTSWDYKTSKLEGIRWLTSSYNPGSTASYGNVPGGGTWWTSSICTQSFSYDPADIRMDVTNIVRQWQSGSIPNDGFIVKLPNNVETDSSIFGSIKFFSRESHTIFLPRLEVYWNDTNLSGTGSFTEIASDDFVLYCKNLRESYSNAEKPNIKIGSRNRFVQQTYASSSNYLISSRLPTGSYFQIQDVVTDEVIIPFNTLGTKVNCDSNGNYIKIDCNSLLPERAYKLVFKTEFDGGDTLRIVDDNHIFKITRH